jgi:hypothetical protein
MRPWAAQPRFSSCVDRSFLTGFTRHVLPPGFRGATLEGIRPNLEPMTRNTKKLHNFFASIHVAWCGSVASIIALVWYAYDSFKPSGLRLLVLICFAIAAGIFLGVAIYSIRVRQENKQFREACKTLHRINHDYRDTLSNTFSGVAHTPDLATAAKLSELKTLKSACQKIAKIYSGLTHCDCCVTVKLITNEGGSTYCETHARSEENSERDCSQPAKFEVKTGRNTAFDKALAYNAGKISHFFSADLQAEAKAGHYRNQRDNWSDFYRCAIIVPIRCVTVPKDGTPIASDDIGFLCVDTTSPRRLNDDYHLELLAGFADQMYNFMSLMRGKYVLPGGQAAPAVAAAPTTN